MSLEHVRNLLKNNQIDAAISVCSTILKNTPDDTETLHLAGLIEAHRGNFSSASEFFQRAVDLSSEDPKYIGDLAFTLAQTGQADLALEYYHKSAKLDPRSAHIHNSIGVIYHAHDQFQNALLAFAKAIDLQPKNLDYLTSFAVVAEKAGHLEIAFQTYQKLISISPNSPIAYNNIGNVFKKLGRGDEAISAYRKAIELEPDKIEYYYNLMMLLEDRKDADQLVPMLGNFLRLDTNNSDQYTELYKKIGVWLHKIGRYKEAVACFERAVQRTENDAHALIGLGTSLAAIGKAEEAVDALEKGLRIDPNNIFGYVYLGSVLTDNLKQYEKSAEISKFAIGIAPKRGELYANLAWSLFQLRKCDEAIENFRMAVFLSPKNAECWNRYAIVLSDQDEPVEAERCLHKAIAINSENPLFKGNLALQMFELGKYKESLAVYRELVTATDTPNPDIQSAFLHMLPCDPDLSKNEIFDEHRNWAKQHTSQITPRQDHPNIPDPDRKIKIGYVSPDLRHHAVSSFILEPIRHHNRDQFEIHCFSLSQKHDFVTDIFKENIDRWHDAGHRDIERIAEQIEAEQIDILIDLAGHTAMNRLQVFGYKPAPIQAIYLGYYATSGLDTIDYRILDDFAVGSELGTEEIIKMPNCFVCNKPLPPLDQARISRSPIEENDFVTFGSFNRLPKINESIIELWSEMLNRVPNSRFLIKTKGIDDDETADRYLKIFEKYGVDRGRIDRIGHAKNKADHYLAYDKADLLLDTFPINATTMICEALWLGSPIVTLVGDRHLSRVGLTILKNVGLDELIAETPEEYIEIAVKLANDRDRLIHYNRTLRDQFVSSPVCDTETFTRDLENVYREMWRKWCENSDRKR